MADTDRALKVGIESDASQALSDLDKYNARLEAMAVAQEKARRATAAQEQALAAAEARAAKFAAATEAQTLAAQADKEVKESVIVSTGRLSEATEKAVAKTGDFRKVVQNLTREFPLLGRAAMLFANPITAAAGLAAVAFGFLRSKIAEFEEGLKQTEMEPYAKKVEDVAVKLRAVRDAAKDAADASSRLMDVFNAQQSAEEKVDAARKRLEIARAQGEQDPVKRAARMLDIEGRYGQQEIARAERGRQFRLTEQYRRYTNLAAAGSSMDVEMDRIRGRLRKIGSPKNLQSDVETDERNLKAAESDMVAKEELAAAHGLEALSVPAALPGGFGTAVGSIFSASSIQTSKQAISLMSQRDLRQRQLNSRRARLAESQQLTARLGQLEEQRARVSEASGEIAAGLPSQLAIAGIERRAARDTFGLEGAARLAEGLNQGKERQGQLQQKMVETVESGNRLTEEMITQQQRQATFNAEAARRLSTLEARINALKTNPSMQ